MSEWLTESDWERIASFANASMHERNPELLLPESDADREGSSPSSSRSQPGDDSPSQQLNDPDETPDDTTE